MLFFVIALKAEAQPIIKHFKLKLFKDKRYNIYVSDDIALIVSGVGKINAAIATTYLAMLFPKDIKTFLNIGIAGHVDLKKGSSILAHKITDDGSKKALFPSIVFDLNILSKEVITVDKSRDCYLGDFVYDMESFAFFKAASKFSLVDLIHCLKIISDNKFLKIEQITLKVVEDLIFQNIKVIEKLVNILIKLAKKVELKRDIIPSVLIENFHFTECEKYKIRDFLWRINSLNKNFLIEKELGNFDNKKKLFSYLEHLSKSSKLTL